MSERLDLLVKNTKAGISIMLIPALIVLVTQLWYFSSKSTPIAEFQAKANNTSLSQENVSDLIMVDIAGEVVNPGVYEISADLRLEGLIELAGGFTESANKEYVDQHLNMAKKLLDAEKLYIPDDTSIADISAGGSTVPIGLISLNNSSGTELESLPGVGPATASKIISARPFSSIEGLLDVPGIGSSRYAQIKDLVQL